MTVDLDKLQALADAVRKHPGVTLIPIDATDLSALIAEVQRQREQATKIEAIIVRYGGHDGGHHKQWILDQIIRILLGAGYPQWKAEFENGADGPNTYEWDEGIPP